MTRHCWRCGRPLDVVPPTTCAHCGEIHYVNPKPCGNAVVVHDGRVLLVLRARAPDAGAWTVPGGFCEDGEHPRAAAERELSEETGLSGRAVAFLGTWMDSYGPPADDGLQITTAVSGYLVELRDPSAAGAPDPAETAELRWWPLDDLPSPLAFPAHVPAMIAAGAAVARDGAFPPMYDVVATPSAAETAAVPEINDRRWVSEQYSDAGGLDGRIRFWRGRTGPQPQEIALERIRALRPREVLEVGCGPGEFAAALAVDGIDVTAIDQSPHMVELTAARGIAAVVADIEDLPFDAGCFDVVVGNFVLNHVADLERGLRELVRVLRAGGALVVTTNSDRKLRELWDLLGRSLRPETFSAENGAARLGAHFAHITRIDVTETFAASESAILDYVSHTRFAVLAEALPALPDGLRVTAASAVFVATR